MSARESYQSFPVCAASPSEGEIWREGDRGNRKEGRQKRQETPSEEKINRQEVSRERTTVQTKVMAENNTNPFLDILQSFDAGK